MSDQDMTLENLEDDEDEFVECAKCGCTSNTGYEWLCDEGEYEGRMLCLRCRIKERSRKRQLDKWND